MSSDKIYVFSEETRNRCKIIRVTSRDLKRYQSISLETFHYFYKLKNIDFSIYFRSQDKMVEFITPKYFSEELLTRIWKAVQKDYEDIDVCILKNDFAAYQHMIDTVRATKLQEVLDKDPKLDRKVLQVFGNLSSASQMVVRGGIDNTVVDKVKASAAYMVSNLMDCESSISTLSRMVLCDPTLYDHSASVAMIGAVISKYVLDKPLSDRETRLVSECGMYHDVGKTCVPPHILNKPGRFTDEEFEIMKSHTTLGHAELLEALKNGAKIDELACRVALEHHERFDGTGYPNQRQGRLEENQDNGIHFYTRIVTIADVYSALLMKRVYKEAYSREKAIKIMANMATSHFDPQIFNPFVKSVAKSIHHDHHKGSKVKGNILLQDEKGKITDIVKPSA